MSVRVEGYPMKKPSKLLAATIIILLLTSIPLAYALNLLVYLPTHYGYRAVPVNEWSGYKLPNSTCNDEYLSLVRFEWRNTTNAADTLTVQVFESNASGLGPNTGTSAVATSIESYTGGPGSTSTWYDFNFDGTLLLNSSSYGYFIMVHNTGSNAENDLGVQGVGTSYRIDTSGTWSNTGADHPFTIIVYTTDVYGEPTATPSSPVGGGASNVDQLIAQFTSYLIPLILFLLPGLILGWLTKWEKWPILIGLAIGSGLVYLFLGAQYLWLVILVVIGIGASAYQSTRGG